MDPPTLVKRRTLPTKLRPPLGGKEITSVSPSKAPKIIMKCAQFISKQADIKRSHAQLEVKLENLKR